MTYALLAVCTALVGTIVYLVYALRDEQKNNQALFAAYTVEAKTRIETDRNQLGLEKDRDSQMERADKAETELADVSAQLKATQAELAKASKESTENAAAAVKNAPDPLAELNRQLSSPTASSVPDAGNAAAGHSDQVAPAVQPAGLADAVRH